MDNLTKDQRKINMQHIRSKGTIPEKIFAKELRERKIKFSQHLKSLTGKPDFVFRKYKLIVFIDSDFWHGNPHRCIMPKTNQIYWEHKIQSNKQRDAIVNRTLRKSGWKVLRFWEYDIRKNISRSINRVLNHIEKANSLS
jgi:DNA mismatch endonuclease Vsr